ncbi:MAG TPA: response regulator [Blastocatellia bacterium]|nr:response regulator [Blastocatellia bacterium]
MARVLVVDDEISIAMLLNYYLGSVGHSVSMVESPVESLSFLNREPYDVVVLDVVMKGAMSGLDVCRLVKSNPRLIKTRILVISGAPEMEVRAREAGADAFLAKPFGLEEVKAHVTSLLAAP